MDNKYRYIRWFAYVIEILVFFAIQQTPGLIPEIFGERPILLIPILVSIALFEDEMTGLWFGVFIGLLMDFGISNVLGFSCIFMTIFGYLLGLISVNFIKVNILTYMISIIIISAVLYLSYFVFGYLPHMYGGNSYILLNNYLPRFGYTVLISPIFYFFNKTIAIQLQPKED